MHHGNLIAALRQTVNGFDVQRCSPLQGTVRAPCTERAPLPFRWFESAFQSILVTIYVTQEKTPKHHACRENFEYLRTIHTCICLKLSLHLDLVSHVAILIGKSSHPIGSGFQQGMAVEYDSDNRASEITENLPYK